MNTGKEPNVLYGSEEVRTVVFEDTQYKINLTRRSAWGLMRILDGVNDTLRFLPWFYLYKKYRLRQAQKILLDTIDLRIASYLDYMRDRTIVDVHGDLIKKNVPNLEWYQRDEFNRTFDYFRALVWYRTFYQGV